MSSSARPYPPTDDPAWRGRRAILVIGGLSVTLWAALVAIVYGLWLLT